MPGQYGAGQYGAGSENVSGASGKNFSPPLQGNEAGDTEESVRESLVIPALC